MWTSRYWTALCWSAYYWVRLDGADITPPVDDDVPLAIRRTMVISGDVTRRRG